jgi:cytochrome P450
MEAIEPIHSHSFPLVEAWKLLFRFREKPLETMAELRRADGGELVRAQIGSKAFFMAFHPEIARRILKDDADKFRKSRYIFEQMGPLIGKKALVRLEGEQWAKNRKLTTQFFAPSRFEEFLDSVDWALSERNYLLEHASKNKHPLDIARWATEVVLLAAGKMLFRMDLSESLEEILDSFLEMNRLCGQGIRSVVNPAYWMPSPRNLGLATNAWRLHRTMKREFLKSESPKSIEEHIVAFFRNNLDLRKNPNKTVAQMIAFLFPAFETTSTSLCWSFQLLAANRTAQSKIRIEVGDTCARPAVKDFGEWKYLESSYKEALRLYPPAWILAREPLEDMVLEGVPVPAGSTLFLSLREIHRHPSFWTFPNAFIPDRFLDGTEPEDPFAFIPFGAGPRICSGNNLGLAEGMLILARTFRNYRMELLGEMTEADPMITLRPKGPVMVRVEKI